MSSALFCCVEFTSADEEPKPVTWENGVLCCPGSSGWQWPGDTQSLGPGVLTTLFGLADERLKKKPNQ